MLDLLRLVGFRDPAAAPSVGQVGATQSGRSLPQAACGPCLRPRDAEKMEGVRLVVGWSQPLMCGAAAGCACGVSAVLALRRLSCRAVLVRAGSVLAVRG
ncbi:hypothetical protein OAO87_02960 [bacterium]|nr:hypothetical protein [bacterium]